MSAEARMNVLLEDIKAQNRATYEGVMGAVEALGRRLDGRFERIEERLTILEDSVRKLLEAQKHIVEEVAQLRGEIDALRKEISKLRTDFERREELARLDALERRVALLEKRRTH